MTNMTYQTPKLVYSALELPRVLHEMSCLLPAHYWLKKKLTSSRQPVMVLPGFGADDRTTVILRRYLNRWGYDARPWKVGRNLNPRDLDGFASLEAHFEATIETLGENIARIQAETGMPVALVGWSLGGIVARLLASRFPERVSQIITLGTPFGDCRSTVVYPLLSRLHGHEVDEEDIRNWEAYCNAPLTQTPLTIIYSKSDGFVPPHIATRPSGSWVENIEVVSSHVGFAVNPVVLNLLAQRLATPCEPWQRYQPAGVDKFLYKVV